jgi:hypothetical protein
MPPPLSARGLLAKRNRRSFVSWVQSGGGAVVACIQDMVIGQQ